MNANLITWTFLAGLVAGPPAGLAAAPAQHFAGASEAVAPGGPSQPAAVRSPAAFAPSPDTVIPVARGTRLMVRNHEGSITVRTWDRAAVRLAPSPADVRSLQVAGDGKLLRILSQPGRQGGPQRVDIVLTVPAEMALDLSGPLTDVRVENTRGQVTIETVNGEVSVRGGSSVSVRSVNGDVRVRDSRSGLQIHSVSGDVDVGNVQGDVAIEAISGDVVMRGVRSENVRVSTVNGDVLYDGEIRDGGRYRLATHNGDVMAGVASDANLTVAVRTFAGDFRASFPVTLQTRQDKRFEFTLGDGSARLELEAFNGELRLVRPAELPGNRR